MISALYRFSCTAVDAEHRRRRFQAHYNNQHGPATDYYYSPLGRTSRIAAAGRSVDYAYVPKSNLLERRDAKVGLGATGTKVLASTHLYDAKGNLTDVQNMRQAPFNVAVLAHHYGLDALNRREVAEREDGTHWTYVYDSRSQVTSGKKYLGTGPLPGMQNEYEYDNIGNRLVSKDGGNMTGGGLRTTSYVPNALNQYTNITRSGFKTDFVGTAGPSDVVSVNGTAAERVGPWWRAEVTPSVGSLFGFGYVELNGQGINGPSSNNLPLRAPAYPTFTNFVPNGYDADGNLLSDGRQTYVWDGENRLIEAWAPGYGGVTTFHLVYAYDSQSRRISKKVFAQTGYGSQATQIPLYEERYLYDGWNLACTLRNDGMTSSAPVMTQSYIWGPDLSGSLQGAGGVGGLLMTVDSINAQIHFPAYDGNGNLMVLVRAETGTNATVDAAYEYDPFGRTVRATGPAAQGNPFRFSTKFTDDETGLVYYGYRYYDAMLGRWLSRDPIEERGGVNMFCFVKNSVIGYIDHLGMWATDVHDDIVEQWLKKESTGKDFRKFPWKCGCVNVIKLIQKGSAEVDGDIGGGISVVNPGFWEAQSSATAYQHSMRSPGEGVENAKKKAHSFILKNIDIAIAYAQLASSRPCRSIGSGGRADDNWAKAPLEQGLVRFGYAFHTITDSFSPAHTGYQVWYGPLDFLASEANWSFYTDHANKEEFEDYRSIQSAVVNATKDLMHEMLMSILNIASK